MRCVIKDLADHPAGGDGCDRLADALYRQGQGKTDVPLTAGAKVEARRADNACLVDQFQAEGHAVGVAGGQRGPHKHAAVAVRYVPADAAQAAAQGVAAGLILAALAFYAVQRAGQGGDGGFLHRQEQS